MLHQLKACSYTKSHVDSTLPMIPEQVTHPNSDIYKCPDCRDMRVWDQKVPNKPLYNRRFLHHRPPVIYHNHPQPSSRCLDTDNEYLLIDPNLECQSYDYWSKNLAGQIGQGVPINTDDESQPCYTCPKDLHHIPSEKRKWLWGNNINIEADNHLKTLYYYNPHDCLSKEGESKIRNISVDCLQTGPYTTNNLDKDKNSQLPVDKIRPDIPRHPVPHTRGQNSTYMSLAPDRIPECIEGGCKLSQSDIPLEYGIGKQLYKPSYSQHHPYIPSVKQGEEPRVAPALFNRPTSIVGNLPTNYEHGPRSQYWEYVEDCVHK